MKGKKKGKLHNFKHVTKKEKHNSAGVTGYISRTAVTKKLQVSIHQFRQLCILKGIHPVEPGLKRIRSQRSRTWFYLKDVNFMRRDEIMNWFINMKIYNKKKKYLRTMKKTAELAMLKQNKPKLNMDHFVRERYPTLQDAVNDLDDGLSLISLFVEMQYGVAAKVMSKKLFQECIRLKSEWLAFVAETHALRKVFVSIKGIYYQAEMLGAPITWLVPHPQRIRVPKSVDVITMSFFVQFYTTALNFVFYRLYTDQGFKYPPTIDTTLMGEGQVIKAVKVEKIQAAVPMLKNETPAVPAMKTAPLTAAEKARIEIVNRSLAKIITVDETQEDAPVEVKQEPKEEDEGEVVPKEFQDVDEREGENKEQYIRKSRLFSGFKFFINREIPNSELRFMIRAFGGEEFTEYDIAESDPSITHQIVDRDLHTKLMPSREYIQPQWIFDSINAGILLPVHEYAHDATLPPHISPFVNDALKGYTPAQREHLDELIAQEGKVKAISDRSEKDEEEGENPYIGENDEDDLETIEAQYARELAAEQQGKSYAGYVQDVLGTTELADDNSDAEEGDEDEADDDDSDAEMEAALKKKVPTKKERREEAMKKDEEDRERMAIDLLNRKTRTKIRNIKKRVAGAKERNDALVEKRAAIEKRKKKEAQQARKALPQEQTNGGKRKEEGEGENKPAKKIKK